MVVFYRKILNDLSAEEVATRNEGEEEASASSAMTTVSLSTPIYQTSSGQYSTSPCDHSNTFISVYTNSLNGQWFQHRAAGSAVTDVRSVMCVDVSDWP